MAASAAPAGGIEGGGGPEEAIEAKLNEKLCSVMQDQYTTPIGNLAVLAKSLSEVRSCGNREHTEGWDCQPFRNNGKLAQDSSSYGATSKKEGEVT